jgi:GNAT superfamily N-acetyltransferase
MSVKENILSNPLLVTEDDYVRFITTDGRGWICEEDGRVVGFAIVDTIKKNIWALFIHPDNEQNGLGKQLHQLMLDWYFKNYSEKLWLTTAAGTRASKFYQLLGWKEKYRDNNGEIIFEMELKDYRNKFHEKN